MEVLIKILEPPPKITEPLFWHKSHHTFNTSSSVLHGQLLSGWHVMFRFHYNIVLNLNNIYEQPFMGLYLKEIFLYQKFSASIPQYVFLVFRRFYKLKSRPQPRQAVY